MYIHRDIIKLILSVRSLRRIQNKKHFQVASFIFHFSEQFKTEYSSER